MHQSEVTLVFDNTPKHRYSVNNSGDDLMKQCELSSAKAQDEDESVFSRSDSIGAFKVYKQDMDLVRDTRPKGQVLMTRMTYFDVIL